VVLDPLPRRLRNREASRRDFIKPSIAATSGDSFSTRRPFSLWTLLIRIPARTGWTDSEIQQTRKFLPTPSAFGLSPLSRRCFLRPQRSKSF